MTLLSLSDFSTGYGRTPVLRDVNIDIREGEIAALIGRNGVGKTTLMKSIIGLLSPTKGTISFQEEDITTVPAERRAHLGMGYVPQGREVFPRLTVEENLRIGALINQDSKTKLYDEVYNIFPRLADRKTQRAGTMSGGEQQMLSIGRALVGNPVLLLLDEVSEGVQPTIVEQISEAVQDINEDLGTTIFFVEQNLDFTVSTSERCYVMEKGTIVNELPANELRDSEVVQKHITM